MDYGIYTYTKKHFELYTFYDTFTGDMFGYDETAKTFWYLHEIDDIKPYSNLQNFLNEYFGNPLVLWSHTTIQLEGKKQTVGAFVAAGVLKQTLDDFDVPFEFIYGKPDDENVFNQIQTFYRVSRAINKLKKARIGLIGYPALGMYTGTLDHITMRKKFPSTNQIKPLDKMHSCTRQQHSKI